VGRQPPAAAVPLYLQIHAVLKERIVSGRYGVSSVLPTEAELCAEFKASRYTIREALRGLSDEGFVHRRQRTGTVVVSREPQVTYAQSFRSLEDLFQIATTTHYVLLQVETVALDEAVASRVGGEPGEDWIRVTGVRWDKPGGTPICYIHSYVPARYAAVVAEFPAVKGPFYALLEQRSGEPIEEVVQEINAVAMPDQIVRTLGLMPGSLSLLLLRRYTSRSGTLIASFNWHRADQFTYAMQLHRRAGAEAGKGRLVAPRLRKSPL
jgi:DNA-binding GntR family transcriptional regulator